MLDVYVQYIGFCFARTTLFAFQESSSCKFTHSRSAVVHKQIWPCGTKISFILPPYWDRHSYFDVNEGLVTQPRNFVNLHLLIWHIIIPTHPINVYTVPAVVKYEKIMTASV